MKILMVTPYLPFPPASGGQIRTLNLLKYLSKNNEITLVCLYKYESEKKYVSHLQSFCRNIYLCKRAENPWKLNLILRAIFSTLPFLIVRNFSTEAQLKLKTILESEKFDVIHAETFYVMPHIPKTKIPILLVEQTIEFKVYQHFVNSISPILKPFFYIDILKLKFWEQYYWKKATRVATVSESDKKIVNKIEPNIAPSVIPNGAGAEMISHVFWEKDLSKPQLLFQGNFLWLQNTEAAIYLTSNVFPKIISEFPNATLTIAGQNINKVAKRFKKQNGVKVIDIPADKSSAVKKLYRSSTLFLAPIFGPGGTRLKILAAMASGLPVISTSTGFEGLNIVDKKHALIAESVEGFIEQIKYALSNKKRYEDIRLNAHILIENEYNWEKIAEKLVNTYKEITN